MDDTEQATKVVSLVSNDQLLNMLKRFKTMLLILETEISKRNLYND